MALGERLSLLALIGIVLAAPALTLVSLAGGQTRTRRACAVPVAAGLAAGGGFALLFIALDRAGTAASAWPLLPGQSIAIIIVLLFVAARRPPRSAWRASRRWALAAGLLHERMGRLQAVGLVMAAVPVAMISV